MKSRFRMLRYLLLACSLAAATLGCANAPAQSQLRPGLAGALEVDLVSDLKMRFPRADYQHTTALWTWSLESAPTAPADNTQNADNLLLTMKLHRLKATMISLTVRLTYDSTAEPPADPGDKTKTYRSIFEPLPNAQFRALVDRSGNVLELQTIDPPLQAAGTGSIKHGTFGGYQAAAFFSPQKLQHYAAWALWTGPPPPSDPAQKDPTQPDYAWKTPTLLEPPRTLPVPATLTYTVKLPDENTNPAHTIAAITANLRPDDPLPDWAASRTREKGLWNIIGLPKASGALTFDTQTRRLVECSTSLLPEVRMQGVPQRSTPEGRPANRMFYQLDETLKPFTLPLDNPQTPNSGGAKTPS